MRWARFLRCLGGNVPVSWNIVAVSALLHVLSHQLFKHLIL